jgi:hypothetical protein
MAMMNKRGWIKMLEVTIAITIMVGAILFVYSGSVGSVSLQDYIYTYHKEILSKISIDNDLRGYVMSENVSALRESISLPSNLDYSIRICDLTSPPTPCNMDSELFLSLIDKEIYARDTIVVANLSDYSPKRVKLFIWEV